MAEPSKPDYTRHLMPLLPPKKNFADLREVADQLMKSTPDNGVKRLADIVGMIAYRCDLLEREVERLGPVSPPPPARRKQPIR